MFPKSIRKFLLAAVPVCCVTSSTQASLGRAEADVLRKYPNFMIFTTAAKQVLTKDKCIELFRKIIRPSDGYEDNLHNLEAKRSKLNKVYLSYQQECEELSDRLEDVGRELDYIYSRLSTFKEEGRSRLAALHSHRNTLRERLAASEQAKQKVNLLISEVRDKIKPDYQDHTAFSFPPIKDFEQKVWTPEFLQLFREYLEKVISPFPGSKDVSQSLKAVGYPRSDKVFELDLLKLVEGLVLNPERKKTYLTHIRSSDLEEILKFVDQFLQTRCHFEADTPEQRTELISYTRQAFAELCQDPFYKNSVITLLAKSEAPCHPIEAFLEFYRTLPSGYFSLVDFLKAPELLIRSDDVWLSQRDGGCLQIGVPIPPLSGEITSFDVVTPLHTAILIPFSAKSSLAHEIRHLLDLFLNAGIPQDSVNPTISIASKIMRLVVNKDPFNREIVTQFFSQLSCYSATDVEEIVDYIEKDPHGRLPEKFYPPLNAFSWGFHSAEVFQILGMFNFQNPITGELLTLMNPRSDLASGLSHGERPYLLHLVRRFVDISINPQTGQSFWRLLAQDSHGDPVDLLDSFCRWYGVDKTKYLQAVGNM